eukprot:scaffold246801_cov27-Tisochrysis_lutea.AAC.4
MPSNRRPSRARAHATAAASSSNSTKTLPSPPPVGGTSPSSPLEHGTCTRSSRPHLEHSCPVSWRTARASSGLAAARSGVIRFSKQRQREVRCVARAALSPFCSSGR